jgi:hypothetical protein
MQMPLDDCLNQVETRNVDIEPEFAEGNCAVRAGFRVRIEVVGKDNKCDGGKSPSNGAGNPKQQPMPLSDTQDVRSNGAHRLLSFWPLVH